MQAGDVQRQQHAAALQAGEEEEEVGDVSVPTLWSPSGYYHAVWGEQHPDIKKTGAKRAVWSVGEKEWISNWIQRHPDKVTGYAKCLQDIHADPAARFLFHPLHVLDSKRIRSGFEAVAAK